MPADITLSLTSPQPSWRVSSGYASLLTSQSPEKNKDLNEVNLQVTRSTLSHAQRAATTLTQDIDSIRSKLRELKVSSDMPITPQKRTCGASSLSTSVMLSGSVMDGLAVAGIEEGMERVKLDLDTETRHRVARDAEATHRMELLHQSLSSTTAEHRELDHDVRKMENMLESALQKIEMLQGKFEQEADARQVAEHSLQKQIRESREEYREAFKQEAKDRARCNDDLLQRLSTLKDLVEGECSQREQADAAARSAWQKELVADREVARDLTRRLQEAELAWSARAKSFDGEIDGERSARSTAVLGLEQRISEMSASMAASFDAAEKSRLALKESLERDLDDRVRSQKSVAETQLEKAVASLKAQLERAVASLKDSVEERFESVKTARESLRDELHRERSTREAQAESHLVGMQASHKTSMEPLVERLVRVERQIEDTAAHAGRGLEANRMALESLIKDSLLREREAREAALDQVSQREHAAKISQHDLFREHETRLSAVRTQVDELGERCRSELALKWRELQAEQTRASDAVEAQLRSCRHEVQDARAAAEARQAEEQKTQRASLQLEERVAKLQTFIDGLKCAVTS